MFIRKPFCMLAFMPTDSLEADLAQEIESLPFGEGEIERLQKIKNPSALKNSLAAMLCLKNSLAAIEINTANSDLTILRDKYGKPYFKSLPLCFSITHSADLCALALSDKNVGIDLEFYSEKRNYISVAKRFFNAEQYEGICRSATPELDFLAVWTKKEALGKLCGKGLSYICSSDFNEKSHCFFKEYRVHYKNSTAFLSLCFDSENTQIIIDNMHGLSLYEVQ